MPRRILSRATARTVTSMSSPIMMLWFVFRVRTSTSRLHSRYSRGLVRRLIPTTRAAYSLVRGHATGNRASSSIRRPASTSGMKMARKPLRSQLNQIRAWVRQGRTDAWIAHQLDVSTAELREFRRRHELSAEDDSDAELDLRDEIEAEIEATMAEEDDGEEADED